MRNIIYILLIIGLPLSAQNTAKYQGKTVTHNGSTVRIQADNIPTSPDDSFVGPEKVSVWSQDFESSAIEDPYTETHISEDFPWYTFISPSRTSYVDTDEWLSIVSYGGSRVMKHHYKTGNWGTGTESGNNSPGDGTGGNIFSNLATSGGWDELYLKYKIKISSGFDWGEGGKLPGFSIQPTYTDGGYSSGATVLMMWQPDSAVRIYAFYDSYTFSGSDFDFELPTDEWFTITMRLVNNTVGSYDGIVEAYFNGVKDDYSITNASFREQSAFHINVFRFNTFQGGGDVSYAPANDGDIWIDDIEIFYLSGDATTDHPIGNTAGSTDRDISHYID